jgi:hypothetical protein
LVDGKNNSFISLPIVCKKLVSQFSVLFRKARIDIPDKTA